MKVRGLRACCVPQSIPVSLTVYALQASNSHTSHSNVIRMVLTSNYPPTNILNDSPLRRLIFFQLSANHFSDAIFG